MHTHADRTIRRARNVSRIIGAGVGFVFGVLYGVFVLSSTPGAPGTGAIIGALAGIGVRQRCVNHRRRRLPGQGP